MANTTARAHVDNPAQTPASAVDPEIENCQASDDENDTEGSIENAELKALLSKEERRKLKKLKKQQSKQTTIPAVNDADSSDELSDESARLTRKQRWALKKQQKELAAWGIDPLEIQPSEPPKPPYDQKPPKTRKQIKTETETETTPSIPPTLTDPNMAGPVYYPLLVCSLGNPGPQYANTLHSAGHKILDHIRDRGLYMPFVSGMSGRFAKPNTTRFRYNVFKGFTKDGTRALVDGEDDFTLWQSTKLMNISGGSVQAAWRTFSAQQKLLGVEPRLVVVHDELEAQLGKVSIKMGTSSPRGHNGLKSVQASMGGNKWWRVGVGIGRPESRDAAVVSKYVLRKMSYNEEKAMDSASVDVLFALRKIAEGKA